MNYEQQVKARWPDAVCEKRLDPGPGAQPYYIVWNLPQLPDVGRFLLGLGLDAEDAWDNAAKTIKNLC